MTASPLVAILETAVGRDTFAWRFRRPLGERVQLESDRLSFDLEAGERRYLLAAGLADDAAAPPEATLFDVPAGGIVRIDAIAGAEGLPPECQLWVQYFDAAGVALDRRKSGFHAARPYARFPAPAQGARASLILQLGGQGRVEALTLGVETVAVGSVARMIRALKREDFPAAREAAREAEIIQPRDPRLPRLRARLAWQERDFNQAADLYLALEARRGLRGDDPRRLVSALRRSGRLEDGEAAFSRLFEADTTHLGALTEWARLAEQRLDLEQAAERWTAVLRRTEATSAAERLASVLDRRGYRTEAERVLTAFAESHPRNIVIRTRLAERLRQEGRFGDAAPHLRRLVELTTGEDKERWRRLAAETGLAAYELGSMASGWSEGQTSTRAAERARRRVDHWLRYADKGLDERATAELRLIGSNSEDAEAAVQAAWALAGLALAQGPQGWPEALTHLEAIQARGATRPGLEPLKVRLLTDMGRLDEARAALEAAPMSSANLTLAEANLLHARRASDQDRLVVINRLFSPYDLASLRVVEGGPLDLDHIDADAPAAAGGPLVSVIMPVWNAEATLETAIRSIQRQSWLDWELLVVDDASPDGSWAVAERLAESEPRIRLLRNAANGGPYVSRNHGLAEARGVFVTCHDSDDWAHPQRLERQVAALLDQPEAIGNMSRCVTATPDLRFASRSGGVSGFRWNFSSVLFRRQQALEAVGFWDEARFGADGEYVARLRRRFGRETIAKLDAGPLAIVRQSATSLTGHATLGLAARGQSARTAYRTQFEAWHRRDDHDGRMERGAGSRFPRPAVVRGRAAPERLDVVLASDFRLSGGTTASNVQEIVAQARAGLSTGLIQLDSPILRARTPISDKILDLIDYEGVHLLTSEQAVEAGTLIVRWPPAAANFNSAVARVTAGSTSVIVNQTPWRGLIGGELIYEPAEVDAVVQRMFGARPVWRPIGPAVRGAMLPYAAQVDLASEDWINVVDLSGWAGQARRPSGNQPPVIGRHGRDFPGKWPMDPAQLLAAYPDDGSLRVSILGGAEVAEAVIGRRPAGWQVHPFDSIGVADYLAGLDVFVYFPDPTLEEAFGRAILEAMAAGVPTILPERFQPVFGDASLYGRAEDVRGMVESLTADADRYEARSRAGLAFAVSYGHPVHIERLKALGVTA
ncbi:glycosyltransferase [Brevundimonas lutea]|uniref:glycosyltransferase n=1 Tax=Brevundimonas lutea TaxID=2293980 RepID=UPI000F03F9CE|nr:glycosyltransferase [Brevundimonas lutea]